MNRKNTAMFAFMLIFAIFVIQILPVVRNSSIRIAFAEEPKKCVYLTFDDGPSDKVTPKILDILKEEQVPATFFIIGKQAEIRKYLIEREYAEGHCVAVHSYTHEYKKIYASPESLISDIDRCNKLIKEVTGEYSYVYRFPGGSFGLKKELIEAVTSHGMRYVDWNASNRDAELYKPTPYSLYQAAITTPANREHIVMLSHDSTDKTTTVQALKDIIHYYKSQGYVFERF